MERANLEEQVSKLGHNILQVRLRAIDNILFKLSVNLIDLNQLCLINNGQILQYCIQWFYTDENRNKFNSMLILINKICNLNNNNTQYIEYFLDKHLPSFLHKLSLKHQFNQNELQIIQEIITKLISSPKYNHNDNANNNNNNNIYESKSGKSDVDTKENLNDNATNAKNEWRFPYIALIRSDIEYLFDISLRLKVDNASISEYALLEVQYLVMSDFPPEIILQSDTHLLDSLFALISNNEKTKACNYYLIHQCIHVFVSFIDRINNSLHLRYDPAIITHPASKYNQQTIGIDMETTDDYKYPNDNAMANADNKCISINKMIYKLCHICITKLLLNNNTKYVAFTLINKIFDSFLCIKYEGNIQEIIKIINLFQPFIESMDMNTNTDVFSIQIIEFITKCLLLCPDQYLNNEHIATCINHLLSSFIASNSMHLNACYSKLSTDIIQILYYLQPQTNKKIKYVENVLSALRKLDENIDNLNSLTLSSLRSTFIALPFNLKYCKPVIECILNKTECNECISMLLLSPSSHIINECLDCLSNNIDNKFLNINIDIIYILLLSIHKHESIQLKVMNILQLLLQNKNETMLAIYKQLFPLLSLYLINKCRWISFEDNNLCLINTFRLCFHSEHKIRCVSHKKIMDYYLQSIINQTENEEKLNKPSDYMTYEPLQTDIEQEKSKMDQLVKISNYDLFHYDEIKKYAMKYTEKKQQTNASLKDLKSTTFEVNDIYKILSILSNKSLDVSLKITAANQLLIIFTQNKKYWNILREKKILNLLIENLHSNRHKNDLFIIALLEIIKLLFEINMFLDECNLSSLEYESIITSLLYINFMSNTKIRYLFSNIIALIAFHPTLLLSQKYRSKQSVQKEKESYSPKLLISHANNTIDNYHLWIPKFVSEYCNLLLPQHKIRWTPPLTKLSQPNNDDMIKKMITQQIQSKTTPDTHKTYQIQITNKILAQLSDCKNHIDFIQFISQIMSLFDFCHFIDHFCSQTAFYSLLERILSVAPLSPNDDRVFVIIIKCIICLIKSDKFLNLMRKQQFKTEKQSKNKKLQQLPMELLLKLNSFINNTYIKYIVDIPSSKTNTNEELNDLSSTKVMVITQMFLLFETFIIFISKHNFIDQYNEYQQTLNNIIDCIIKQLIINPISYQYILQTNVLIADNIRLQFALKCLLSILTQTISITANQLFVDKYLSILMPLILDICSRNKTPNSFAHKNQFKTALICLDFMLEHFISDTQEIYAHHKHLSWLIRLLSDRECLVKSLTFSVFASLLQSSDNSDTDTSSLKLILCKNKEFIDYMFDAIQRSSSSLVRIYSMDCLRLILNLYLKNNGNRKRVVVVDGDDDKKREDEDESESNEDLQCLMNKYVFDTINKNIDITKLLHEVTGNAAYFKSVCHLLKTLIICNFTRDKFKNVAFEAMHFARFRYLLHSKEYKNRYFEHIKLLNVPSYFKSDICLNYSWTQSEGNLQCLESAISVLDIFNVVLHDNTNINMSFVINLMQENCIKYVMDLLSQCAIHKEWQLTASIFTFFTHLIKFKPNAFRDILLKQDADKENNEEWCSNFMFKQVSICMDLCKDEIILLSICKFLYGLCASYPINADKYTASYYRKYNINSSHPSNLLSIIINHFTEKIIEKSQLLQYDESANNANKKLAGFLDKYYSTFGVMLSISTQSKIICCYHCESGDFVSYLSNRLSQMMSLFILKEPILRDGKGKSKGKTVGIEVITNEMIRILQLIQNILYLAPSQIKNKFVLNNLGEILIKMYPSTINYNNNDLHDMLLSVCVNLIAHSQNAKYVICFGEMKEKINKNKKHKNANNNNCDFLLNILSEAFNSSTRLNSYLLCFDILDSMMLNIDGINVLINNFNLFNNLSKRKKKTNLLEKCINLINSIKNKKDKYKYRRICCMKLLRNLAMQTLGQTILIKYFLPPNKLHDIIDWIDINDERFLNIYCQFLRNLGFVYQFKIAFANNKQLLIKIFQIIIDEKQEKKLKKIENNDDFMSYLKLMLDTKLSLMTLIWCLIHKNNKNILFIRNLPSPSLQPLIKRIESLNRKIVWNDKLNNIQILLNSLLDRCKLVNKLLIGL